MLEEYNAFFSILTANERTQLAMTLNPGNPRDAVATWNQKRDGQDKEYLRQVQDAAIRAGLGEKTNNLFKALDERSVVPSPSATLPLSSQQQEEADLEEAIAESLENMQLQSNPTPVNITPNSRPLTEVSLENKEEPAPTVVRPGEGYISTDDLRNHGYVGWSLNLAQPQLTGLILPRDLSLLDPQDLRVREGYKFLPLNLLFAYGAGQENSTRSDLLGLIQLPALSQNTVDKLPVLVGIDQALKAQNIPMDQVNVYVAFRNLPHFPQTGQQVPGGWNVNDPHSCVFNYVGHCFACNNMVTAEEVPVFMGLYGAEGIEGVSIGMNNVVSQVQNFHGGNMLSGNINQLRVTNPNPADANSYIASAWGLSIHSNTELPAYQRAVVMLEIWDKHFALASSSGMLELPNDIKGPQELVQQLVDSPSLANQATGAKLLSVFSAFDF